MVRIRDYKHSGKNTQFEDRKTETLLRESRIARRNSEIKRRDPASDNRAVRNAETDTIAAAEQRRSEKQKWLDEQERARTDRNGKKDVQNQNSKWQEQVNKSSV